MDLTSVKCYPLKKKKEQLAVFFCFFFNSLFPVFQDHSGKSTQTQCVFYHKVCGCSVCVTMTVQGSCVRWRYFPFGYSQLPHQSRGFPLPDSFCAKGTEARKRTAFIRPRQVKTTAESHTRPFPVNWGVSGAALSLMLRPHSHSRPAASHLVLSTTGQQCEKYWK